jgi:hypothetical protein
MLLPGRRKTFHHRHLLDSHSIAAMKTSRLRLSLAAAFTLWLGQAPNAFGALGIITTTFLPPSPVTIGTTITVSANITGYTEVTEIDGYAFNVNYPAALFSFVAGSFSHGTTAAGISQQWLAKANQEAEPDYGPDATDDGSLDGVVSISFNDGAFSIPERGTVAASGFLVSFQLLAEAAGSGNITPAQTSVGAPVFFDVDLNNVPGAPSFVGSPITVVPEPFALTLGFGGILLMFRRRARGG